MMNRKIIFQRKKKNRKVKRFLNFIKKKFKCYYLRVYVVITYHNFILSLCKFNGNIVYTTSSGLMGFETKRKVAFTTGVEIGRYLIMQMRQYWSKHKVQHYRLFIFFKGLKRFRRSILKGIKPKKRCWFIRISALLFASKAVHNGCSLKKKRRKKRRSKKRN